MLAKHKKLISFKALPCTGIPLGRGAQCWQSTRSSYPSKRCLALADALAIGFAAAASAAAAHLVPSSEQMSLTLETKPESTAGMAGPGLFFTALFNVGLLKLNHEAVIINRFVLHHTILDTDLNLA